MLTFRRKILLVT